MSNLTLDTLALAKTKQQKDTSSSFLQFNTKNPIPKRSGFYSALLPGLGQVYNKNYVRAGIVWVGIAAATYNFIRINNNYQTYRTAYVYRIDNDPTTISDTTFNDFDNEALKSMQASERSRLDKAFIYIAGAYFINIADALVSAHLKSFDVSKDISMKLEPALTPQTAGLKIVLNF